MSSARELMAFYRATTYLVTEGGAEIRFRIGEASEPLDDLLARREATSGAFITAWNPASRALALADNEAAQVRLKAAVHEAGLAALPAQAVPDGAGWETEDGFFIPGITRAAALALAVEFGQYAIVLAAPGRFPELASTALMPAADPISLVTPRLLLRPWRDDDLAPFAALNADPAVMAHLPKLLTPDESAAMAGRIRDTLALEGFGFWAVEIPDVAPFIGFVGLAPVPFTAHFAPAVQIGWRLAKTHWGQGYATEAAWASLDFGFGPGGLTEIVSFTVPANRRSRNVMTRLGMNHDPADDFDHPRLPPGNPLRRHILYRLTPSNFAR